MKSRIFFHHLLCLFTFSSFAQTTDTILTTAIEGYVFENNNQGFLKNVTVTVLNRKTKDIISESKTDRYGKFTSEVVPGHTYSFIGEKKNFLLADTFMFVADSLAGSKAFVSLEMERKPGYVFDVSILNSNSIDATVDAIEGARIEIFNNTKNIEELVLNNFPRPNFKFNFEKGNHYTLMIRKKNFITKRIEAYIDIEDCILCFDGLGIVDPGVTDVMAHGNDIGTFLANVELEPLEMDKIFRLDNIYYDYDKWTIRNDAAEELDKVVQVLKDNPDIIVEMGSHTDARGSDPYNATLSEKRAQSAAEYLVEQGILRDRLTWKGYGETVLVNQCDDGINCPEQEHQANRRTELKIVGVKEHNIIAERSLKEIVTEERLMREIENSEIIHVRADDTEEDRSQHKK